MNKAYRVIAALGAAVTLATAAVAGAMPAQAQATWGVVFTTHYGAATNYSGFTTVIAPGQYDAWAFGANDLSGGSSPELPEAEHWDGTAWQASALPAGVTFEIIAASAISPDDIWAVTEFGGYVLHWNGVSWSVATQLPGSTQDSGQLTGITALSDTDVWVFGNSGFTSGLGTWYYNGSSWTQQTGSGDAITAASALSASNIWAFGSDGIAPQDEILQYNGTAWQPQTASALTGLTFYQILALSDTDIWASAAVGGGSTAGVLVHFDGTTWSQVTLPLTMSAGDIASDGQGGIWVTGVDTSGNAWAADMSSTGTWSTTEIGPSGNNFLAMALIPGTTSLWGAGWVDATTGSNATIWAYGTPPAVAPAAAAVGAEGGNGQLYVQAPQLAAGWQAEGGQIQGAPAVAALPNPAGSTPASPVFFATGSNGELWMFSLTAGWAPVGPEGALCIGSPATAVTGTGTSATVTVACEGLNRQLYYTSTTMPSSGLPTFNGPWTSLGGILSAGPAVAPVGGTLTLFAEGTNGQVFTNTGSGYTATPWICTGTLAAATQATTGDTTFGCQGGDHTLWTAANDGTGWLAAQSLGGQLVGGPGIAAASQQVEFYVEGTNGTVWQWTPLSGWASIGGIVIGGVGATALN
jgi:hypothetical protein